MIWSDFKNEVKSLLSDASINDATAYQAVAEFVLAHQYKDMGNLDLFKIHYNLYQDLRRQLLGWSISVDTATLRAQVRNLLSDVTIGDDVAVRAIAEYVQAEATKNFTNNADKYARHVSNYNSLRIKLCGYTVTLSDSTLKSRVKELITDTTVNDDTCCQAIADFVKSRIAREVNHDLDAANSYMVSYQTQKARLLGYSITISGNTLRTAINKLITVDATRIGIYESGGYIDQCITEATADIVGLDTFLSKIITQGKIDLAGNATIINTRIDLAKADIAASATQIDKLIRQSVIDLQSMIEEYRLGHVTVYKADDFTETGEASTGVLPPQAEIRDVYYVKVGQPGVRQPFVPNDWGNRFDLIAGNIKVIGAQYRIAIDPQAVNFVIYPRIVEGRQVEIAWDGRKLEFNDSDTVPFGEEAALAVTEFVRNKGLITAAYSQMKGRLYLDARERRRIKETSYSPQPGAICAPTQPDDTTIEFVAFGNSGDLATISDTNAVAVLVQRLDPDFIVHLGNASYPLSDTLTMQENFIPYYANYINAKKMFMAFGRKELDASLGADMLTLLPYIKDLNSSKLYYNFSVGSVEFFVLNSNRKTDGTTAINGDGIGAGSAQDTWLQAKLSASTATWKIVVISDAPNTSDVSYTPGVASWQLDYKGYGADLVLSAYGRNYERIFTGIPRIVLGTGGAALAGFGAATTGSQIRYNTKPGAMKFVASSTKLQATFMNTNNDIVDVFSLTK